MSTKKSEVNADFRPDWTIVRSSSGLEAEFQNFKFEGPGWYITKGINRETKRPYEDTVLIVPVLDDKGAHDGNYVAMVWNHSKALDAVKQAVTLPVRIDERNA
jgi:hypothetical protein